MATGKKKRIRILYPVVDAGAPVAMVPKSRFIAAVTTFGDPKNLAVWVTSDRQGNNEGDYKAIGFANPEAAGSKSHRLFFRITLVKPGINDTFTLHVKHDGDDPLLRDAVQFKVAGRQQRANNAPDWPPANSDNCDDGFFSCGEDNNQVDSGTLTPTDAADTPIPGGTVVPNDNLGNLPDSSSGSTIYDWALTFPYVPPGIYRLTVTFSAGNPVLVPKLTFDPGDC